MPYRKACKFACVVSDTRTLCRSSPQILLLAVHGEVADDVLEALRLISVNERATVRHTFPSSGLERANGLVLWRYASFSGDLGTVDEVASEDFALCRIFPRSVVEPVFSLQPILSPHLPEKRC